METMFFICEVTVHLLTLWALALSFYLLGYCIAFEDPFCLCKEKERNSISVWCALATACNKSNKKQRSIAWESLYFNIKSPLVKGLVGIKWGQWTDMNQRRSRLSGTLQTLLLSLGDCAWVTALDDKLPQGKWFDFVSACSSKGAVG